MSIEKIKEKRPLLELLEFGILNIDKPSGPTSFTISNLVRKKLNLRKTSHFGTLDPMVTGVLPIALNRACKLTGYFLGEDKEYIGVMRIHEDVELKDIAKVIKKKFLGKIKQTPPVKSRVKRQEREREIKKFELLEKDGKNILFRAEVEGGTYIRKLIDDLGKELGIGAHMLELRRTRAGIFSENDKEFLNLYDFERAIENNELDKTIIPAEEIIKKVYPVVQIKSDNLKQIFTGKPIYKEDVISTRKFKKGEVISVFCDKRFVGMYKITSEEEIFARAEFVMQEIKK
ncbi:RNA-guided pseudouridylation complex pseudouridine synthase subunit Cbf5 [Candidatus Pacearchaeota archaeon]|jgi:H/ACA ribonucleoprotein complex subunit 4|nr:RNA-guided pseudouridylation complex pseudouridine synthase subunit Cbf5 [Candidatus Pacearchaeota archaeon]|tara:strand:+ start:966 stop:1829 length:864 start_codon:yes stop_codon:yes gene_type:complete